MNNKTINLTIILILSIIVIGSIAVIINQSNNIRKYSILCDELASDKRQAIRDLESLQNSILSSPSNENEIMRLTDKVKELETKLKGTMPYMGAKENYLQLKNQDNVHNPSWKELKSFLERDQTDKLDYLAKTRVCGDFSELLHNNAEIAGIRAGVSVIFFDDKDIGHAINVFYTTDYGLVYISSQGPVFDSSKVYINDRSRICNLDKVFYAEIGKGLGSIDMNYVTSFDYNFYETYKRDWIGYSNRISAFNKLCEENNNVWSSSMKQESDNIDEIGKKFSHCFESDTMGTVKTIELFW
jgi:hypothetical protein